MRPFLIAIASTFAAASFAQADAVDICLFETEDWEASIAACTQALAASDDPIEQGRFIAHRGFAHEELGDLEAARLDYLLATQYRPDWAQAFINAAGVSEALEDPESHLRWAIAATEASPDRALAYSELLYIHNNSADPTACAPVAERIMENLHHPIDWAFAEEQQPYLMGNLGYCLHSLERHEEALQAYQAAEHMGLEEQWIFNELAQLYFSPLEQDEQAIEAATRALSFGAPDNANVYILVMANAFLGQFDEAIAAAETYAAYLDAADQSYGTRNELAWALYREARYEPANALMERWIAAGGPDNGGPNSDIANAWDTVGHIRAALGDADGALAAFTTSLEREAEETIERRRGVYRQSMEALGITVGAGMDGLLAGLAECTQRGAECHLVPDGFLAPTETAENE